MRIWGTGSLRGQLTRGMIWMQVFVMLGFTSMAAIPIVNIASVDQGRLDPRVIDEVAESIKRSADGGLYLEATSELAATMRAAPHAWMYAVDQDGVSVQTGQVPSHIASLLGDLKSLESASVADTGDPEAPTAIMRQHSSALGNLWIVVAGGPEMGLSAISGALSNPIFLGLLLTLVFSSFFLIPLIVDRAFRGVDRIAGQADLIDVKQRGVRLSSKKIPDEIHPMVSAINSALQRLDDGFLRQQRFLADAAHELRTPIAILHTRIEMMAEGEERNRLMLDLARLANLANQLLDLQRLEGREPSLAVVNLVQIATDTTSDMAPLVIAAGSEISLEVDCDEVLVKGDAASLARALTNLIQNAIVHAGSRVSIVVRVERNGTMSVADDGPGVPEEHRQSIFEPFHRVTPLDHGAGLGLNLVLDIVRMHDGTVTIDNAPIGGAIFAIKLPVLSLQT